MRTRENKHADSFFSNGFEYKGKKYKPISADTMRKLEQVESPIYTGLGTGMGVEGLLDVLYIIGTPLNEVNRVIRNRDDWELAVSTFGENLSMADLAELTKYVAVEFENIQAAVVESRPEKTSEKK